MDEYDKQAQAIILQWIDSHTPLGAVEDLIAAALRTTATTQREADIAIIQALWADQEDYYTIEYQFARGEAIDALRVDGILSMSDEEILADFQRQGLDLEQHAIEMRALFEAAVKRANEQRASAEKLGYLANCAICGMASEYIGPYWRHVGERQPRHPALPKEGSE